MKGLGRAARSDSATMKTVALVTMAFLPATFIAVSCPEIVVHQLLNSFAGAFQYDFLLI